MTELLARVGWEGPALVALVMFGVIGWFWLMEYFDEDDFPW